MRARAVRLASKRRRSRTPLPEPTRQEKVLVILPTVPRRKAGAVGVINSFLSQGVDRVRVYLNGYRQDDRLPTDRRVRYIRSPPRGPIVRYLEGSEGFDVVFTVDDDLSYPQNYVDVSIDHLKHLGEGFMVSYQMAEWSGPGLPYVDRVLHSCHSYGDEYLEYPYAGSGTAVYWARDFHRLSGPAPSLFEFSNDAWMSARMRSLGIRLIRPPTKRGWIMPTTHGTDSGSIYKRAAKDGYAERDQAIRVAEDEWGWSRGPAKQVMIFSQQYWERRYAAGGTSGAGSYGELADFKASVLNDFVKEHGIQTVVDMGCGDGNQLALAEYPRYLGVDVSPTAIRLCREKFRQDDTKSFTLMDDLGTDADLALSLDVLYHLVEDSSFTDYLASLFRHAKRFVVVYSTNRDELGEDHVRHREFLPSVLESFPDWELMRELPNPLQPGTNFFFFRRK